MEKIDIRNAPADFYFADDKFKLLMHNRITNVLIICSSYDYFILEEDGRIDEQIFNEYIKLNLRYPPQFTQVSTSQKAFDVLEKEKIDLVITMLSVVDTDTFELANKIKILYPEKPIVVLTPFSREVSVRMAKYDLSSIDYVFSWLGNADILLAIIKLIEDKMNVENDTQNIGVQTILLVEDSVRFYSSYLPAIYKIIMQQSLSFMQEGVNEHQRTLRMRGRPKILLARNYEEAIELFEKYKENMLGVITDMSFRRNGTMDRTAGEKLCKHIKKENKLIPLLLQSSDIETKKIAKEIRVGYLFKKSKTLLNDLKAFITEYFAFGDFVFKDPDTKKVIARAKDLKDLQKKIFEVPDKSLKYHAERRHFSKWLYARALFSLAGYFKMFSEHEFENTDDLRDFMDKTITAFRKSQGKGIIAKFYKDTYDESIIFARIGEDSIGGKARGLAFIDSIIKKRKLAYKYKGVHISIPLTVVIATSVFDEFMTENDLWNFALEENDDQTILERFTRAKLPKSVRKNIKAFLRHTDKPIAVRSSSLLEDSHYQPFAGVYSTYMVPNSSALPDENLRQICLAIKSVYASVYYKETKAYMDATSYVIEEEKMAIILQEVCGTAYEKRFYPTLSGVARSINFYPIGLEKPEDGIANIALGLGKHVVEGQKSLRFSPKHPDKILQLSTPELALRETQKHFFALDLNPNSFSPSTDEGVNLLKLRIKEAEKDGSLKYIASTYDYNDNSLKDGTMYEGKKVITFANLLKYKMIPLGEIIYDMLKIFEFEMNNSIEIEFSLNLKHNDLHEFKLLQIRPIVESEDILENEISEQDIKNCIICSDSVLGNGCIKNIKDIIYVKTDSFDPANNEKIVPILDKINKNFASKGEYYVLVGPGRWGSSDPWLGIPVKWANISAARVIVESNLDNYRIDPSQGTHFFQNLTSFRVGYFTINTYMNDGFFDTDFLNKQKAIYEDDFIRHVRFDNNLLIKIDGKNNKGIISLPQKNK